jgi:hypothetical protein
VQPGGNVYWWANSAIKDASPKRRLRRRQEGGIVSSVKKKLISPFSRNLLLSSDREESLKELLRAMPPVGEDKDFERVQDFGRDEVVDSSPPEGRNLNSLAL